MHLVGKSRGALFSLVESPHGRLVLDAHIAQIVQFLKARVFIGKACSRSWVIGLGLGVRVRVRIRVRVKVGDGFRVRE